MHHEHHRRVRRTPWGAIGVVLGGVVLLAVGLVALLLVSIDHYYSGVARKYGNIGQTITDRSHRGIAEMQYDTHWYRNANRCTAAPGSTTCMRTNTPPCRSHAWLATHHRLPLIRVGGLDFFHNDFRSVFAAQGTAIDRPNALYVANGNCDYEYLPAVGPAGKT